MLSNETTQILKALKDGLTPAEVAVSLGHDIETVEFVAKNNVDVVVGLARHNLDKATRVEDKVEALEDLAMATLKEILVAGDKDSVRLAASIEVLDTIRGLKKPKNVTVNFNNFDFNDRLHKMKERREKMLSDIGSVDLECVA